MCGRTACALDPDTICDACTYKGKDGKRQRPIWKDSKTGNQYRPSYNISPGHHTPVMLSSKHRASELEPLTERIIQPMYWGLVPSWHKGDPKKMAYGTNNCKSETMLEKRTFKTPLEKGRRCVVLAEGFYEWKKEGGVKQPYFFTSSLESSIKSESEDIKPGNDLLKFDPKEQERKSKQEIKSEPGEDETTDREEKESVQEKKPLLMMAGVFDICYKSDSSEPLYSYSVLTVPASSIMTNIHHRMPAILSNEEEVEKWLNFDEVALKEAVHVIKSQECLKLSPVSTFVNNSQNNSPECIKPIVESKPKNLLTDWLSGSKKKTKEEPKEEDEEEEEIVSKKIKLEK